MKAFKKLLKIFNNFLHIKERKQHYWELLKTRFRLHLFIRYSIKVYTEEEFLTKVLDKIYNSTKIKSLSKGFFKKSKEERQSFYCLYEQTLIDLLKDLNISAGRLPSKLLTRLGKRNGFGCQLNVGYCIEDEYGYHFAFNQWIKIMKNQKDFPDIGQPNKINLWFSYNPEKNSIILNIGDYIFECDRYEWVKL